MDTHFHVLINTDFWQNQGGSKLEVLVKTYFPYYYIFLSKICYFFNSSTQPERMVLEISMLPFAGPAYTFDDVPGARLTS